jgi:O-antigen ligase/tetratricopeptide (TPR) repeat protein
MCSGYCFAIDRFSANLLRPDSMARQQTYVPEKNTWVTNPDLGRLLFFVFLAVLPTLFATNTLENFEYPKAMWLRACMLCFLAPALLTCWRCVIRLRAGTDVSGQSPLSVIAGQVYAVFKRDLLTAGVLLIAASALLSTVTSLNPRISLWGEHTRYGGLTTILAHVAVFFCARAWAGNNLAVMERLLVACLLAGVVAAAFAFLQMAGVDPVGWQFSSAAGLFQRPFGTLGHPNHLGAFLAMVLPVAWHFAVPPHRHAMIICALILSAGIAVSLSRAAWLGCVAGAIVLAGAHVGCSWNKIRRRSVIGLLLLGLLAVAVVGWWNPRGVVSGFHDRLANWSSGATRWQIWTTSFEILRDHPIVGTGPDTFQLAFAPRRTPAFWRQEWNTTPTHAHNEFLHVLATQGIIGAVALLVFLLGLIQAGRRALSRESPRERRLVLALLAGLVVFLVVAQFTFTAIGYGSVFLTMAAFLSRLGQRPACSFCPQVNKIGWLGPALVLAAALIFLQFAWNLSFGFSVFPVSFWLATLTIGLPLAGTIYLLGSRLRCPASGVDSFNPEPTATVYAATVAVGSGLNDVRTINPRRSWLSLGAIAVAAVASIFLVILPWLAHITCARGDSRIAHDPGLALTDFEQAIALDPWWDIYWTKLAHARHLAAAKAASKTERQALLRDAQTVWEHLIRHNRLDAAHHDNHGQCLALLAQEGLVQPEEVFASFEEGIRLDPSNPLYYADAADASLRLGRLDKAWDFAWRGARDQFQCGPLYGQIGYLFLERNMLPDAVSYLEESLVGFWDEHENWKQAAEANLIAAYHRTHDFQKLEKLAVRFLQTSPRMAPIRALLADAQEQQGDIQNAMRNYRLVLEQAPEHRLAREAYERLRTVQPMTVSHKATD